MSGIQPRLVTLDELLSRRLFRIPEYQRNYSWRQKHRNHLFEDIERTWSLGEDRSHFMATIVGFRRRKVTILTNEHQVIEIVDGQQRITTLVILLKAIAKALHHFEADRQSIGQALNELLVKQDKASLLLLQTNHDTSHHFAQYLRKGNHPPSESAVTLPDHELLSAIENCEQFVANWPRHNGRTLEDLVILVKNRMNFIYHEISDEALVYSVFEVLNSRGLDVSWFDRLKSMLMAIVFEAENGSINSILKEVHGIWADIYRRVGLRVGLSSESLRFAATLRKPECQSRLLNEEKAAESLRKISSTGADKVIETSIWLKDVTEAVNKLVTDRRINSVTRIMQARIVATSIHLRQDLTQDEKEEIMRRWENVTFRIYGMCRRDARTAVGDYVRLAWSVVMEKIPADTVLRKLSDIGKMFPIEKAIEELRERNCYDGWRQELRYFFYRYEEHLAQEAGQIFNNEQWNRIWTASAAQSIEHILPQNTGDFNYIHRLGNLLILPPKLNSKLGAKPPQEKVDDYNKTGLLVAQELADMLPNWGPDAIEERENSILDWAQKEWAD